MARRDSVRLDLPGIGLLEEPARRRHHRARHHQRFTWRMGGVAGGVALLVRPEGGAPRRGPGELKIAPPTRAPNSAPAEASLLLAPPGAFAMLPGCNRMWPPRLEPKTSGR